jgi:hypothetical protein
MLGLLDKVVPGDLLKEDAPPAPETAPAPIPPPRIEVRRQPATPPPAAPVATETGPTVAEMESQLLEHIEISDEELQALAANRAAVIRDHLLASGKVEADRATITTPGEASAEDAAAKAPRIEFNLK